MKPVVTPYFHKPTGTWTYVVSDTVAREAAVIDPVLDYDWRSGRTGTAAADAVLAQLADQGLRLRWILETLALLSKEFVKWLLLPNAIALPAAYLLIGRYWLASFAYRPAPGILTFPSVAGLSLAIALLTVSWQAVRAAVANPVDSLRYE